MISEVHGADSHAPFPHKLVSGIGARVTRTGNPGKPLVIREQFSYEYVICAVCGHGHHEPGDLIGKCNCRANCHDV